MLGLVEALDAVGLVGVPFDTLVGGVAHDFGRPEVRQEFHGRLTAGEFVYVIIMTPCGPISIARDDANAPQLYDRSGRIMPCPVGWESYREKHWTLVLFTIETIELCDRLGVHVLVENPADVSTPGPWFWRAKSKHGSLFALPEWIAMRTKVELQSVTTAQCGWGSIFRKWTTFCGTPRAIAPIAGWKHIECVCAAHSEVAHGRRSARSAAYSTNLNMGIAAGVAATLAADARRLAVAALGGGLVAHGPQLSHEVADACARACDERPRFASMRNLRPASDAELLATPIERLRPPAPTPPRRESSLAEANPWPPGADLRRPIAIEQLFKPGVYQAFEEWFADSEEELLQAVADTTLPPELKEWQATCVARLAESRAHRLNMSVAGNARPSHRDQRTYTIPHSDMAEWAADTLWDTSDRLDCMPSVASTRDTPFEGSDQMIDRARIREVAAALGWGDLDIVDQAGEGGLEPRTTCPRDTVISRHYPGFFAHFASVVTTIQTEIGHGWIGPPPALTGAIGHLPTVPCISDPRDVVMRLVSKVVEAADGSYTIEEREKARLTTNLSRGNERSQNAGVSDVERTTDLPTVGDLGTAAGVADLAYRFSATQEPIPSRKRTRDDEEPPPSPKRTCDDEEPTPSQERAGDGEQPPLKRARVGFYALDLSNAYRYVMMQQLYLWLAGIMWLDAAGRLGICTDRRLCFGGAYGPNRFERITTLLGAFAEKRITEYHRLHPYPTEVIQWQAARRELQDTGMLAADPDQLEPHELQVYIDDANGVGGLEACPHPVGYEPLEFDAEAMRLLGLEPAPAGCRLLGDAAITAGEFSSAGFKIAAPKSMVGSSIISLGLQVDAEALRTTCPKAKQRILVSQSNEFEERARLGGEVDRKSVERYAGRINNISQVAPELSAEIHGAYRVANARERSGARRLLGSVPIKAGSRAAQGLQRLSALASNVLSQNAGIPLAPSAHFPSVGSTGVMLVQGDASGDIKSMDAGFGAFVFHSSRPGHVFIVADDWQRYPAVAEALAQSALEPSERSGAPRLSMPAAELFTSWAAAEAAADALGLDAGAQLDIIAVGDCQPASNALNRASSSVVQMRVLLQAARRLTGQWLGVQVPRESNLDADHLSHPSEVEGVRMAARGASLVPIDAPVPERCWDVLWDAIVRSNPEDEDF